jgi:STE24 endopeptidase
VSTIRALVLIALVALAGAALVALVSRAPASVRNDRSGPESNDPSLGASFTDEQVARHGAYRLPSYVALGAGIVIELVTLFVLARGPFGRVVERVQSLPGGRIVHAAVLGAGMALVLWLAALPLAYVRGFAIERAWGLSTQDAGGWLSDSLRGALVATVMAAIAAAVFFAVVARLPRTWWIAGWAAFTLLTAIFVFIYPVVVAPLFNRFTPVADESLEEEILTLADAAEISVDEVLVADASRRTTAENAYVGGLGSTKQVVLYDTLIEAGRRPETLFVVAHEMGHEKESHVLKNIALASAGLLVGFGALAWLAGKGWFLSWAGASSISDVRALPVLLIYLTIAGLLVLPLENAFSRASERRADEIAVELTGDPEAGIRSFRRLGFSNLADLRPPRIAELTLFTHPSIPDRIRSIQSSESASASPGLAVSGAVKQD